MKLVDGIFVTAIWNEDIRQWDVTTDVTKAVFTTNSVFHILDSVEVAVAVEGKIRLAANHKNKAIFRIDGEIAYIGNPENMRDFNIIVGDL